MGPLLCLNVLEPSFAVADRVQFRAGLAAMGRAPFARQDPPCLFFGCAPEWRRQSNGGGEALTVKIGASERDDRLGTERL
jgi:hypothetical protein